MDVSGHWQRMYSQKAPEEVSWFQEIPSRSAALVQQVAPARAARILDVGGGASTLVDTLLASGYTALTVLDLAPAALAHAQARLGGAARTVTWVADDILTVKLPPASVDVWHDRAVFHFLTQPAERAAYLAQVRRVLRPGGYAVIATFAEDGPTRCSGLEVVRYSENALHAVFGDGYVLEHSEREMHTTPSGAAQAFTYCVCRWSPAVTVQPVG
ncbi:MAG: class I SAM-dependent methyltransferase [Gemmatimonadaceae bacterium]|nr:class I SAM-dependent methyltransferase [Gemmatimonadaceae bacterium]